MGSSEGILSYEDSGDSSTVSKKRESVSVEGGLVARDTTISAIKEHMNIQTTGMVS